MLYNRTKKRKLIEKTRFATTPWSRLKGLMFENPASFNYALIFNLPSEGRASASIHMLFVFFPIDAVFLNKEKRVVDIARNLKPFTPGYAPKKPAKFLIELPAGKAKAIALGDELDW